MFTQATTQIYNLQREISTANSRICNCENQIYGIKTETYDHSAIWNKIEDIEYTLCGMKHQIEELMSQIEILSANTNELFNAARADLAVKSEKPKQKIDLEISEQNDGFEVDPYTTPQYYLDDKKKNDYWYWNGE